MSTVVIHNEPPYGVDIFEVGEVPDGYTVIEGIDGGDAEKVSNLISLQLKYRHLNPSYLPVFGIPNWLDAQDLTCEKMRDIYRDTMFTAPLMAAASAFAFSETVDTPIEVRRLAAVLASFAGIPVLEILNGVSVLPASPITCTALSNELQRVADFGEVKRWCREHLPRIISDPLLSDTISAVPACLRAGMSFERFCDAVQHVRDAADVFTLGDNNVAYELVLAGCQSNVELAIAFELLGDRQ